MIQIRAEQFAAMRRKKVGDALIAAVAPFGFKGEWGEQDAAVFLEDGLRHRSRVSFDQQGFLGAYTSQSGRTWRIDSLSDGSPAHITSPSGHRVSMIYDQAGLLSGLGSSTQQPVQLQYTAQRELSSAAYADGTWESIEYAAFQTPVCVTDRTGAQSLYTYDSQRRLTSITDGAGAVTTFQYSVWDRPDAVLFPNGTSEKYLYDEDGRLNRIVQGDVWVDVAMNDKGKPLSLRYSDGIEVKFEYDDQGLVTKAESEGVVSAIAWTDRGQVQEEIAGDVSHVFQYDAGGRLTGVDSAGRLVSYTWDADNRLIGFTDWNGAAHSLEYADGDAGVVLTHPGTVRHFATLGLDGKTTSVNLSGNGKALLSLAYSYDAEGRLSTARDSIFGDRVYGYDAEGRLLQADASAVDRRESFAYDRAGNAVRINGLTAVYDAANQLLEAGDERLHYDSRGNLTERNTPAGRWLYRYDARNHMVASVSPAGVSTTYSYDAFGRRTAKRTGAVETRFTWAGELLVSQTTVNTTARSVRRQDFLYHPETHAPLATSIDGRVYSYHNDQLGTPRALTDENGAVVWLADYAAFGHATVAVEKVSNPLRFLGQYYDAETDFHYNRFRYYVPDWGRYTSRDPLGFASDLNFYVYAGSNPLNKVDRFGLFGWKTLAVIGAAVATAAAVVVLAPLAGPVLLIAAAVAAGAVAGGLNQALNEKNFSPMCILKAAALGALAGGVSALPFLLLPAGAGLLAVMGAGALGGGLAYGVNCLDGAEKNPSWKGLAASMAVGGVTAGVVKGIGDAVVGDSVATDGLSPPVQEQVLQTRPAEQVNAEMEANGQRPCWKPGTTVTTKVVPPGTQYQMVVSDGQAQALAAGKPAFGGYATTDAVPDQSFARNDLAILNDFKPDVSQVATVETTAPQTVNSGVVGGLDSVEGGANQVQFVGDKALKLVGHPIALPEN